MTKPKACLENSDTRIFGFSRDRRQTRKKTRRPFFIQAPNFFAKNIFMSDTRFTYPRA